ncbi:hypothetical protein Taro_004682 [Colocasia esculenta]|uniref:Uncharacterized protein n=1 Tax=Colocasia esculenta TaxID=4460 RepID=A0A843TVN0_COLES|nr:hypothetical protein [Colocasia esculenta]
MKTYPLDLKGAKGQAVREIIFCLPPYYTLHMKEAIKPVKCPSHAGTEHMSHGMQSREILARSRKNIGLGPFPRNEKIEMPFQAELSGLRILFRNFKFSEIHIFCKYLRIQKSLKNIISRIFRSSPNPQTPIPEIPKTQKIQEYQIPKKNKFSEILETQNSHKHKKSQPSPPPACPVVYTTGGPNRWCTSPVPVVYTTGLANGPTRTPPVVYTTGLASGVHQDPTGGAHHRPVRWCTPPGGPTGGVHHRGPQPVYTTGGPPPVVPPPGGVFPLSNPRKKRGRGEEKIEIKCLPGGVHARWYPCPRAVCAVPSSPLPNPSPLPPPPSEVLSLAAAKALRRLAADAAAHRRRRCFLLPLFLFSSLSSFSLPFPGRSPRETEQRKRRRATSFLFLPSLLDGGSPPGDSSGGGGSTGGGGDRCTSSSSGSKERQRGRASGGGCSGGPAAVGARASGGNPSSPAPPFFPFSLWENQARATVEEVQTAATGGVPRPARQGQPESRRLGQSRLEIWHNKCPPRDWRPRVKQLDQVHDIEGDYLEPKIMETQLAAL